MEIKTYTGVHSDFTQKQYVSPAHAKEAGCVYLLGKAKDGDRPLFDLECKRARYIEAGRWKAHRPVETVKHSSSQRTGIPIEDPHGEIQLVKFEKPMPLRVLFATLQEMSSFNSWTEYNLKKRVQELEMENQQLREKLDKLQCNTEVQE